MITQNWLDETHRAVRLDITGAMTISHAAELLAAFIKAFDSAAIIHCKLAGVTEIDAAGLQLLCSSHRTALQEGKEFILHGIEREPLHTTIIRAGCAGKSGCNPHKKNPCILVGDMN
jgi:ABC-type transporter Mla MlaB component